MNLRYVRDTNFRRYKVATETSGMKNDETTSDEVFYRTFGSVPGKSLKRVIIVIDVAYLHVKGTPLMMRLEKFVKQFLAEKVATDPIWKSLEVTFLGQQVILVACYDIT
jgi:5'-3' exonuclease